MESLREWRAKFYFCFPRPKHLSGPPLVTWQKFLACPHESNLILVSIYRFSWDINWFSQDQNQEMCVCLCGWHENVSVSEPCPQSRLPQVGGLSCLWNSCSQGNCIVLEFSFGVCDSLSGIEIAFALATGKEWHLSLSLSPLLLAWQSTRGVSLSPSGAVSACLSVSAPYHSLFGSFWSWTCSRQAFCL